MQVLSLISFVAVLVAAGFAAASVAWNSSDRRTRSMTAIFIATGVWALLDLLSQLESDPTRAIVWVKLIELPVLALSVCAPRLLADILPESANRMRPLIRIGAVGALLLGSLSLFAPGFVLGVTRTSWGGWMPRYGIGSFVLMTLACVLPCYVAFRAWREPARGDLRVDRARTRAIGLVVSTTVLAAVSTEILLPVLQIPFVRLGALVSTLATALVWLRVLHLSDGLTLTPQGTARELLSDLYDGVALVNLDGTILSSNARLASMAGRSAAELSGSTLSDLVDAPLEEILDTAADRKFRLESSDGRSVPVALSSSCVRDTRGGEDWFVVIFRDLRNVEALRRRLLTSGRLAAIGELAAGIAHEVNNPIAYVRSDLNFLKSRVDEIKRKHGKELTPIVDRQLFERDAICIERALESVGRIEQVVGDVRSFAHVAASGRAVRDLAAIVEGALRLARLERREEVDLRIEDAELAVRVQSGQELKQVLLALLRFATVGSRAESIVRVDLGATETDLRVRIRAESLIDLARVQVDRFEVAREAAVEASPTDFGLAIAIDLADQIGGSVHAGAEGEYGLRIELSWPLEEDDGSCGS